jgi:predicted permease
MTFALNVVVSSIVIGFASWLSGRMPALAGFLVALPLATMLVLPLSFREHGSAESSILLAQSIFFAIPVSLLFFVPFLVAHRFGLTFWQAYALGSAALPVGFFIHRALTKALLA